VNQAITSDYRSSQRSSAWSGGIVSSSIMRLNSWGYMGTHEIAGAKCWRNRYRGKFYHTRFQSFVTCRSQVSQSNWLTREDVTKCSNLHCLFRQFMFPSFTCTWIVADGRITWKIGIHEQRELIFFTTRIDQRINDFCGSIHDSREGMRNSWNRAISTVSCRDSCLQFQYFWSRRESIEQLRVSSH